MFNVKHLANAVRLAGGRWTESTEARYRVFAEFLREEAIPAGGLGPAERDRIESRHLIDSLAFGTVLPRSGAVLDVGSGVGLPGIPLAIARPDQEFLLLDRSLRRHDLCRRAVAMVGLDNVEVALGDHSGLVQRYPNLVMRAVVPPSEVWQVVDRLLTRPGTAVVGLHAGEARIGDTEQARLRAAAAAHGLNAELVAVDMLDSGPTLLRITTA